MANKITRCYTFLNISKFGKDFDIGLSVSWFTINILLKFAKKCFFDILEILGGLTLLIAFLNLKLELRSKQKSWQRVAWSCLCRPLFIIKLERDTSWISLKFHVHKYNFPQFFEEKPWSWPWTCFNQSGLSLCRPRDNSHVTLRSKLLCLSVYIVKFYFKKRA